MSEQRQQQEQIPIYDAHEPSEASQRVNAMLDDMESKHLVNLNDAGKTLIERVATFLGVLFGLSILNSSFPPSFCPVRKDRQPRVLLRRWHVHQPCLISIPLSIVW